MDTLIFHPALAVPSTIAPRNRAAEADTRGDLDYGTHLDPAATVGHPATTAGYTGYMCELRNGVLVPPDSLCTMEGIARLFWGTWAYRKRRWQAVVASVASPSPDWETLEEVGA